MGRRGVWYLFIIVWSVAILCVLGGCNGKPLDQEYREMIQDTDHFKYTLRDGTRCVAIRYHSGVGLSCNWEGHDASIRGGAKK